jgi:hypothetical protein
LLLIQATILNLADEYLLSPIASHSCTFLSLLKINHKIIKELKPRLSLHIKKIDLKMVFGNPGFRDCHFLFTE